MGELGRTCSKLGILLGGIENWRRPLKRKNEVQTWQTTGSALFDRKFRWESQPPQLDNRRMVGTGTVGDIFLSCLNLHGVKVMFSHRGASLHSI